MANPNFREGAGRPSLLKSALRRLFLVRPGESFLRTFPKAPWRYLCQGRRGAGRVAGVIGGWCPDGLKSWARRVCAVWPGEPFLTSFYKAPGRHWRHYLLHRPVSNRPWPVGRPLVSVIIPCYNYGHFLPDAVGSVLNSTWKDLEVIIVEGGSTDGTTPAVVRSLDGGKVRCVFRERRGNPNENRKTGLDHARGKYIHFLDADDMVEPTYLEKAVYALETAGVEVVNADIRVVRDADQIRRALQRFEGETWPTRGIPVPDTFHVNQCSSCSMVRLSFWRRHHIKLDTTETYAEDWDFWMQLAARGARYVHLDEPLHIYRMHGASRTDTYSRAVQLEHQAKLRHKFSRIVHNPRALRRAAERQNTPVAVRHPFVNLFRSPEPKHEGALRVLLCVPWFDQGGSSVLLGNVFRRLAAQGVAVTAVATNLERDPQLTNGQAHYRSFTRDCFCLATCVPAHDRARFLTYLARSRNPDVLLLVGSRLGYETLQALRAARPGLRVIDHLYNTEGHVASNREFAGHIDFHIVASEAVRDHLIRLGERRDKIRVIHHGIDTDLFAPENLAAEGGGASPDRPFTFGFLGRLSEEKRPQDLVALARRLPECHFVLAGDGLRRPQVTAAIAEAGVGDRVTLLGQLSSPLDLYRAVDALVIPSRVEGLPLVLLEAMALGKPVIAARVGMIGHVIESGVNGLTYPSGNLDDLERAARQLLGLSGSARRRLGSLARAAVLKRFTLSACARRYLETFNLVLRGTHVDGRPALRKRAA